MGEDAMYKLAPSILNADYGNLESEIVCADKAGADMIHLDVMDGMFVPCISFGWEVIKRVRHCTNKKFDVHLMINDPDRYLKYFKDAGADIIMLDNMDVATMKEAIAIIDGRAETECSGNVTKENIANLTSIGVDYISSGALTHSAPIMDISLKNLHAI